MARTAWPVGGTMQTRNVTPAASVSGGTPYKQGNLLGVWLADASTTLPGVIAVTGDWKFAAHTGQAFTAGNLLYWTGTTTGKLTTSTTGNILCGRALYAKASSTAVGYVSLNFGLY